MMLLPTRPLRAARHAITGLAVALTVLVLVRPPAGAAAVRFDMQGSLVRCTPVRLPVQAMAGHELVRRIQSDRFFAPTRQAVFFSHAGDRCTWHTGRLAKG